MSKKWVSKKPVSKRRFNFSIRKKIYLFVSLTVLVAVTGTALISYFINANQIDEYFKRLTLNSAENFASLIDVDFYSRLKAVAMSDEYQSVRNKAEETGNESLVKDYFREKGILDEYDQNRSFIDNYLNNMADLTYLYCIVFGPPEAESDMYVIDDSTSEYYRTGYFEVREPEFYGVDTNGFIEPTLSHGSWGTIISAYAPVYDESGNIICHIGCDVDVSDITKERYHYLTVIITAALLLTAFVLTGAFFMSGSVLVGPINRLTAELKKFKPEENQTYSEAGVVDLEFKNEDEIYQIYDAVKTMQMHIVDYMNQLSDAHNDKRKYINDIRDKDARIGEMSEKAYRDALTEVGNSAAYAQKTNELNESIKNGTAEFVIVMVDLNDLKKINDVYGHRAGDTFIKGCCRIVCDTFKHSPVYRIGGDEFVVIPEGEDYRNRIRLIDSLKISFAASFANNDVPSEERYTAAVGFSEYSSGDENTEAVFRRADDSMYEDKKIFKIANGTYR